MKSLRLAISTLAVLMLAALLSGCSKNSTPTGVTPLDETSPAAPSQVLGAPDGDLSGALLQWAPSTSPNVSGYEVLQYSPDPDRDNAYVVIGETDAQTTTFALPDIGRTTVGYYRVRAVTPSGKRSEWSQVALVTLQTMGGPVEPGDPTSLPKPRNP